MHTNKTFFTNKDLLNFLISFIPLSLIIGNLAININIILVCLLGIIIFKFQIFKINQKIFQYLIYSFFLYLILITLIRNLPNLNINILYKEHIIKSFYFCRFLIFLLVVNKLNEKKDFNIKLFFISSAFFSFIVALDILIQVSFGKNILGFPIVNFRPSSFFGAENIAGGYLQKFSFFFLFSYLFNAETNKTNLYRLLFFIFFLIAILLTLNRMSFIIYVASFVLFILIEKKYKFLFITPVLFLIILFVSSEYFSTSRSNTAIKAFYYNSTEIILKAPKLFYYNLLENEDKNERFRSRSTGYLITFNSGVQTWKKNKIFGGGLKSFRLNCKYGDHQTCNTHPHNYILEILVDTGIVGLTLIYLVFLFAVSNFFKFYIQNFNSPSRFISMPFFLILFLEFFPIRNSGSFFTTSNASIIFLMLAVLINISKLSLSDKKLQK